MQKKVSFVHEDKKKEEWSGRKFNYHKRYIARYISCPRDKEREEIKMGVKQKVWQDSS
jgi:hypothetical protein